MHYAEEFEPAPFEEYIPEPEPAPRRAQMHEVGLWVDGNRGWYAPVHMLDLAEHRGFQVAGADAAMVRWARSGGEATPQTEHWLDHWLELQGEIVQWLNDHVAPDGHLFGWLDGDFVLAPVADCGVWLDEPGADHDPIRERVL